MSSWTFFTNHTHVLIAISRDEDLRVRDIAALVGITERAVQRVLGELEDAGVVAREKNGRRTHYEINRSVPLRHPLESAHTIGELIATLT